METLSVPRVVISGSHSGVGKSFLTLGLAYELRRRGIGVSCVLVGPRFFQATILRRMSGRYVRILDEKLLSAGQNLVTLHQAGVGADIVLIEGASGLYDGIDPGSRRGSDSEIASLTRSPAIVVLDARNFGSTLAPMARGLFEAAQGFSVGGTVLNWVDPNQGENFKNATYFTEAFESFGLPRPLGFLNQLPGAAELPRLEINQEKNATLLPLQFFVDLGRMVGECLDVDRIVNVANSAPKLNLDEYDHVPHGRRARIAVSEDSCFSLCFQDNLDLLRYFGAEIVPFSPLADTGLPKKVGGVYLTGAFLAEYGQELSMNESMRESILSFGKAGGVVVSEGGGTAYLCKDFKFDKSQDKVPGVGLIPASAVHDQVGHGIIEAVTLEETIAGRPGLILKGLDTGEWKLTREERMMKVMRIGRVGKQMVMEGFSPEAQTLSTFTFLHYGSNPLIAKNLVDAAEVVKGL